MAKKNNTKRKLVGLVSEESGIRAYYTKKNTMNTPDKLSLRKYDPVLRKHVVFSETKTDCIYYLDGDCALGRSVLAGT